MSSETVAERLEKKQRLHERCFMDLAEQYHITGTHYARLAAFATSFTIISNYSLGMTIALFEDTTMGNNIVDLFTQRIQKFECPFVSMLKHLGCFDLEEELFETLVTIFLRYETYLKLNFAVTCAADELSSDIEIHDMLEMLSSHPVTLAAVNQIPVEKVDVPEIRKRKK